MEFLFNLDESYLFEKAKTLLNRKTYHRISLNVSMVVFKGNEGVKKLRIS